MWIVVHRGVKKGTPPAVEIVRTEFNDGEDKLADILSTLQDEFSFENIYINTVARREADREELEQIGKQIYDRAKEIIREGQLMLPFSDLQEKYRVCPGEITRKTEKARRLVERFLQVYGSRLVPYKGKEGMYYFDDPLGGKRISHVIFDPAYSLENEDFNLLSLSHPYVRGLMEHLESDLEGDITAKVRISESRFAGKRGFLFVYRLTVNNYVDRPREYVIPCFVDEEGRVNNRISLYFGERDNLEFSALVAGELKCDLDAIWLAARDAAAQKGETIFYELEQEYAGKATEEGRKLERFYADKETSVRRIAVDNIREAKLKELEQDRQAGRKELEQRQKFVPSLELLQAG